MPAVKRWFHGHEGRWLVVLDRADTIDNDQNIFYIDQDYLMPNARTAHRRYVTELDGQGDDDIGGG